MVSVIVPAYNSAVYLRRCLDSVAAQTVDCELIVVDDGSSDETAAIVREYPAATLLTEGRRGPYACRNRACAVASGSWFAFLDADDYWAPDKLALQLALAEARGLAMVYSDRYNVGERGGLPERQSEHQRLYDGWVFHDLLVNGNVITTSSVLMRRDLFMALGGFSLEFPRAADWHMWLRVADRTEIGLCPEALVYYRLHTGNISHDTSLVSASRFAIVADALRLSSAHKLSWAMKRRVWSQAWRQNGWDAGRHGLVGTALMSYMKSVAWWPMNPEAVKGFARTVLGRD